MKAKKQNNLKILICVALIFLVAAGILVKFRGGPNGIKGGTRDAVSFITAPISRTAQGIRNGFQGIFGFKTQMRENEALKEENQKLKQQNRQLKLSREEKEELERLCGIFDYQIPAETEVTAANVTGLDLSQWQGVFTIDKGSGSGITKGAAVVSGDGLVGKVSEVSGRTARVVSVLARQTKISFQIEGGNGQTGVIESDGQGKLTGYLADETEAIKQGDCLITSGIGTYPAGLVIGTVTRVKKTEDSQWLRIEAEPAVSVFSLKKVGVLQ
ncbi:rod shape-determining protein MreC [bacterium 210820-DFI.6.37]|nr:rod shape-determining protein MreC [bacterium 210820-DFI.6.37]